MSLYFYRSQSIIFHPSSGNLEVPVLLLLTHPSLIYLPFLFHIFFFKFISCINYSSHIHHWCYKFHQIIIFILDFQNHQHIFNKDMVYLTKPKQGKWNTPSRRNLKRRGCDKWTLYHINTIETTIDEKSFLNKLAQFKRVDLNDKKKPRQDKTQQVGTVQEGGSKGQENTPSR